MLYFCCDNINNIQILTCINYQHHSVLNKRHVCTETGGDWGQWLPLVDSLEMARVAHNYRRQMKNNVKKSFKSYYTSIIIFKYFNI